MSLQRDYRLYAAAILVGVPIESEAQRADTTTLDPVVISATKNPAARAALTQSVTVITREQIQALGITRVSDALQMVPGVAMVQNGSIGSVNTLFLRGGESRYTRVLIDGVAVNAPGGFFDFSHLTTDNVERIEIVRGPASVVHGADAMTGVVQIFTRQGKGPLQFAATGRAGSHATREATADMSGRSGGSHFSIGGGARRTDGVLAFNNQYYNGTLSGSAGFAPVPGARAAVSARYTAAEFHYPTDYTGAPVDSNAYRVQHRLTAGVHGTSRLTKSIEAGVLLGANDVSDLTEDIAVPFGSTVPYHSALRSRHRRKSGEAGLIFTLPSDAKLSAGAEYVTESEWSVSEEGPVNGASQPTSAFSAGRNSKAVYAELTGGRASRASYTFAARRDDNSDYEAFTTYRAGASFPLEEAVRIRASISTAFNAPAFNQLRPTLYTVGSPGLRPENTRAWEVAVEEMLFSGGARISAAYFNQRFRQLIQFVQGGPPGFLGSYANLTEAESNGFEVEFSGRVPNGWSVTAAYSRSRPRVRRVSPDYTGNLRPGDPLIRRPVNSGSASLSWASDAGSLSFSGTFIGSRPDLDFSEFPSRRVTLASYARVDVAGSRKLLQTASGRSSLSLTARVENALNRGYEDVLNFPAPGRTILLGARYDGRM